MNFIKILFSFFLMLCVVVSCSTNENEDSITFNFTNDLEGWNTGTSGKQLDSVTWIDWAGMPPGAVKLDGSDFGQSDHMPNAWIYKEIDLPENVKTLHFLTSAHNRANANAELRVKLKDETQNVHILLDWELANNGIEDELDWIEKSASIETFAGQTVTLYFEQGDNDIGVNEQRYIDKIEIK